MKNRKVKNHFDLVKWLFSAVFAIFLLAGSHCGGCGAQDVELAQKQKLIDDLRVCNAAYHEQLFLSENIFNEVRDIGCFEEEDKKAAEALLQDLKTQMDAFATSYTEQSGYAERAKVIQTAQNAEVEFRTVANQYQQLQEYLAYCRVNHIMTGNSKGDVLENGSPTDQDKLYLHILGDVFGENSGFEGFEEAPILSHRINVLKVIQAQLQGRIFIKDEAQVRPCQDSVAVIPKGRMPYPDLAQDLLNKLIKQSENAADLMKVFHGDLYKVPPAIRELGEIGALQAVLKEQLAALQPGESAFLPAGWSGHAIFYQFTREKKDDNKAPSYTFRIFNSGEGINAYHASTTAGYKTQYFPFVEVKEISQESIAGLVFLKSLKEIVAPAASKSKPQELYEKLLVQLDGKNQQITYGSDIFEDPQHAGTCTYFATPWILSSSVAQFLDDDKARAEFIPDQIEFLINLKTLKDYAGNLEKEKGGLAAVENTRLNLMKKGLVYFSEQVLRARDSFAIDEGTLAAAAKIVEGISAKIQDAEKAIHKKMAKDTPQFDTNNLKKTVLPNLDRPYEKSSLISAKASAVSGQTVDLSINSQLPADKDQLIGDLKNFYQRLNGAVDAKYFILVIDAIQKIALSLSLEQEFWKNTSADQATQIIHELSNISKLYLYALLEAVAIGQRPEKQVSTVELLTSIKFLTVNDLLTKKLTYSIPSMHQKLMGEYLYDDTSIFETEDPKWQWQISLLRRYYKAQNYAGDKDFFGFDEYPAGVATERRIYFDPNGATEKDDSHWSKDINWPDVAWVTASIKKQPWYAAWLTAEIDENGKDTANTIMPWSFKCVAPPELWHVTCEELIKPIKRVDYPNIGEDILLRRLAVDLLTKNEKNGELFRNSLPQAFYDLRVTSVVIDYLLTSTLVRAFKPNFSYGITVEKEVKNTNLSQIDSRLKCNCKGAEGYFEEERYDEDETYQDKEWNSQKRDYVHSTKTRRVARTRNKYKTRDAEKAGTVTRNTKLYYADLEWSIFGKDDDKAKAEFVYKKSEKKQGTPKNFIFASPYLHLKNTAIPFQKYETDKENPKWQYKEVLKLFSIGLTDDGELSDPAKVPTRRRYFPNWLILKSPEKEGVPLLSLESMRGLLGLSSFKEQQLIQTLAYFTKYTERLSQSEYQRMFEKLMMEPSLILDQLTVNERQSAGFINKLASFCQKRFAAFKSFGDYRGMAFILRMNQLFVNELIFASTIKEGKITQAAIKPFLDTPETLFGLIQNLSKQQQDEKSFLYRNLASAFFYKTDLSNRDIELLLLSVIESNTFPLSKAVDDSFARIETKHILTKHGDGIRQALVSTDTSTNSVSDAGKQILDFIVQYAQPDLKGKSDWKIANTGPAVIFKSLFQQPAADIQINIVDGRIFDSGKSRVLFPINEKDYEDIFGDSKAPEYAIEISSGQYQWVIDGMLVLARREDAVTWVVQREIATDSWYQYMPPGEVQQLKANKIIFAGYDYWKSLDKINGKWQFLVLDSKSKKEIYHISVQGELGPEVVRLSDHAVLIDVDAESSYRIFERIEAWRYVYIWAVRGSDGALAVKEVVLPRLWQSFLKQDSAEKEPSLTCGNWKGYTVSKEQFSVALGKKHNYLLCSNNQSDEKRLAIMPLLKPVNVQGVTSLQAEFTPQFSDDAKDNSVTYFSYEIDSLRVDGFAASTSNAARYYLALRYLWQQHYRLASQQIQGILSSSRALNKRESEILQWIAIGNHLDHDPRAYAIRLRAEFELAVDQERYHGQFLPQWNVQTKSFAELYIKYLSKLERVDRGLLGLHQEERIARRLISALLAAIEELKKKPVPVEKEKEKEIQKLQKYQNLIASRILAINAELKNEQFEAELNAISPRELSLMQSASLMSQSNAVEQLEKMFSSKLPDAPSSAAPHALDAAGIVSADNFALLYSIMSGDSFDRSAAIALFKTVLGDNPQFNKLTHEELRREFTLLIAMAVLLDKEDQNIDPFKEQRMNARLLSSVAEGKKNGILLKTGNNISNEFAKAKQNDEMVKKLKVQIEAARNVWWQAYDAWNKLPIPEKYPNGKLNLTYEDESNHYDSEKQRLEKLKFVRLEDYSRLESEESALNQASRKIRDSLGVYFKGVQNADSRQHRIIEMPILSGKIKFTGPKQTLKKGASKDILEAHIPLAEIAKSDPLATPILTEDFFTTLQVISEQALSSAQQKKVDHYAASLNKVLQVAGMASDIETAVGSLREKVLKRANDIKQKSKFYKITNWKALKNVSLRIRGQVDAYGHILKIPEAAKKQKELQNKILKQGRKYADKLDGGAYAKLYHLADLGKQSDINDLIYLLMKRKLVVFYEQSSGANDLKELNELYKNLINYLMLTTYIKHAERVADSIDAVVVKQETLLESSDEFQQLLENMVMAGREIRRYKIDEHLEYLVFEHFMTILLRGNQVAALDELKIKDGKIENEPALGGVLEMIMGAGKTSVLLPLLSALDTSGELLNMIILPEALVASMSEQLSYQLGTAFARGVDVLVVNRQRYLREADLRLLYNGLVRARLENRTIITTNGAVQSLFLSFVDRLSRYEKDKNQVSGEIEAFIRIFSFLREYGRLTIDEVDLALDILQSHQFSVGDPLSLMRDKDKVLQTLPATVLSLYHLIATTPELYNQADLPFLHYSRGHGAITASSYQKFKRSLVEKILTTKPFFFGFKDLNAIFRDFVSDQANANLVKNYLLQGTMQNRDTLLAQIDTSARDPEQANRLKDIVSTLYDELNTVFEMSVTKKLGVHYGHLPKPVKPVEEEEESTENFKGRQQAYLTSRYIAIPYHSGEPMENSRFGTPLEALNYTIQMMLERQNYMDMVADEIDALKRMAISGSAAKIRKGRFEERFENLVGKDFSYPIGSIGPKQIEDISRNIGAKDKIECQFDLISRYAAPQVTVYPMQLQTNAQVYEALFKHVQGFTGTLWSADTFPKIFRKPLLSDTTEKTFLILWQDYLDRQKHSPSLASFKALKRNFLQGSKLLESLVEQIYTDWKQPGSFMDEAGIFRAFDNEIVAKAILENKHVKKKGVFGVIFYDAEDKLKVLDASGVTDLASSHVPLKNRIAFWDKKHTTGSDLKLRPDMEAKVAVDHHTSSRGLQQTVWRLRGLGTGQRVVQYFALEDDMDIIKKRLSDEWKISSSKDDLNLGDLILYVVVNQETRLGNLRFRAVKQKMKNVVVRRVLDGIFGQDSSNASLDVTAAATLYGSARKLFEVGLAKEKLYLSMGLPKHEISVSLALNAEKKHILETDYVKGLNNGYFFGGESYGQTVAAIDKLIKEEEPRLPQLIMVSNFDNDLEIEIELEVETEQEEEQEQEQEEESYQMDDNHKAHIILPWALNDRNRVFEAQFFTPASAEMLGVNPDLWLLKQNQLQPLVSLPEALAYKDQNFLANAFDRNILLSFNLAPLHHRNIYMHDSHYEFEFFSVYHKYPGDVLIIEDKNTGYIRLVLLDGNDVVKWSQFLTDDARDTGSMNGRDSRLGLYNINLANHALYQDGAEEMHEDRLKKNPKFLKLIVEVKFFAGTLHYSKEEEPYLQDFLYGPDASAKARRKYAKKMLDIFRGEILKLKHDSTLMFRGSDIEATFESILGDLD